jgi:protein-L-isoaspartate(D-aspartate) O-methyltransferase
MVREQIAGRGVRSPRLLEAMRRIPRHCFVPRHLWDQAYNDGPLPIGNGQTISQPYMVGVMTELLALHGDETVLEIGTGSGYQAAVLGALARSVHTIERHPALAEQARSVLGALGFENVAVHIGDGSMGWPPAAPYPCILVTAAAPQIVAPLLDQLAEGGRLVLPVGDSSGQVLERWRKNGGQVVREPLFRVAFVPLRGQLGWDENEWSEG